MKKFFILSTLIVLLISCTGCGAASDMGKENGNLNVSDNAENSSDTITKEQAIDNFVNSYNDAADNDLVFAEDFVPSDKQGIHYRTEFRLNPYREAIGKSYKLGDNSIDIIAREDYSGDIIIRLYADCLTMDKCIEIITIVSPILDPTIDDATLNEAIEYVREHKEANGYYYGELGILVLGNTTGYNLMMKMGTD